MPKRRSGLSTAEAVHRLVPRDLDDLARVLAGGLGGGEHRGADRLVHVVLVDEAHLGVELHELVLAVGAQVFVAQAAGDLVVAVDAGHHQQLLEQLRALRQRVERARLLTAGHDELAGTLGRAGHEHRGLDLDEALILHRPADGRVDRGAEAQVALHALAADVEVAVLQAGVLGHLSARSLIGNGGGSAAFSISTTQSCSSIPPVGRLLVDVLGRPGGDDAGDPHARTRRARRRSCRRRTA